MTFDARDHSLTLGRPILLAHFEVDGTPYSYTNWEQALTYDSIDYLPETITRGRIRSDLATRKEECKVTVAPDNPFAQIFADIPPPSTPTVVIREVHWDDPDDEPAIVFDGFVAAAGWTSNFRNAEIVCWPASRLGRSKIPRSTEQIPCNNFLGDERCKVVLALHTHVGTIDTVFSGSGGRLLRINGLPSLTTATFPDYFVRGQMIIGTERRLVTEQSDNEFRVQLPFRNTPSPGDSVTVIAGCKLRIAEDCEVKFSNLENYNGKPYAPRQDIFRRGLR